MNINKAIKKQGKARKRLLLILGFIFFALPIILFASGRLKMFLVLYLIVIEVLILTSIIISINNNYLSYRLDNFKLKIRFSKFGEAYNISCDKVVLVHCEKHGAHMEIILITNSRFRNKRIKEVDGVFIKRHSYLSQEYIRMKRLRPEENYYYLVISKGGFEKYKLLDMIYRNCLLARYTDNAVDRIKEFRNS
jgi:hypothetical protein